LGLASDQIPGPNNIGDGPSVWAVHCEALRNEPWRTVTGARAKSNLKHRHKSRLLLCGVPPAASSGGSRPGRANRGSAWDRMLGSNAESECATRQQQALSPDLIHRNNRLFQCS